MVSIGLTSLTIRTLQTVVKTGDVFSLWADKTKYRLCAQYPLTHTFVNVPFVTEYKKPFYFCKYPAALTENKHSEAWFCPFLNLETCKHLLGLCEP